MNTRTLSPTMPRADALRVIHSQACKAVSDLGDALSVLRLFDLAAQYPSVTDALSDALHSVSLQCDALFSDIEAEYEWNALARKADALDASARDACTDGGHKDWPTRLHGGAYD